jgi:hypothetical protein
MTYSIVYRAGGTDRCSWRRVGYAFADVASANAFASDTERAGYKALVMPTAQLDAIGLPIGWTPAHVDHERDTIVVRSHDTLHVKARLAAQAA